MMEAPAVRSTVRAVALAVLFGVLLACFGLGTYLSLKMVLRSANPAWLTTTQGDIVRVAVVRPGGPADGVLRKGDEIVAVDGVGVASPYDVRGAFRSERPGRTHEFLIRRDGRLQRMALATVPYGFSFASFSILGFIPVSALFLVTGGIVLVLRPHDKQALLLALMFGLFTVTIGSDGPSLDRLPLWMAGTLIAGGAAAAFFWPVFLHFFLVFPEPSPLLRRFPRLERAIYIVPACWAVLFLIAGVLAVSDPHLGRMIFAGTSGVFDLRFWLRALVMTYAAGGLLSLVFNYRQASLSSRRRLRVVVAGSLAGFLPLLALEAVTFFVEVQTLGLWTVRFLFLAVLLTVPILPVSFAYAIVRHQVIPVRMMIRRGLRYLLVAKGFLLIEALAVVTALGYLLTGSRGDALERLGRHTDIVVSLLVTAGILGLLTLIHRRVMPVIDRRYFRGPYDAQRIVGEIGAAARSTGTFDSLVDLVAARIAEALHPEDVTILLRDAASEEYVPAGSAASAPWPRVPVHDPVADRLRASPRPLDVEESPWSGPPPSALLLPIVTKGDLLGILSLGPRLGDLPYSTEDKELLNAIAWQLAFALENSQLVHRMAEEERLRREISMAGEVQRRLFPERPPESGRLELAGLCHPAQGIGGDYYDFLALGGGHIGLAVADVAGKGISAALLMSVVQASLRSQARADGVPLTALVASMNELLYRSTARNSFASFFYAQFDERTRRLTYVNAGHNPPLLVRPSGFNGHDEEGIAGGRFRSSSSAGGAGLATAVETLAERSTVRFLKTGGLVIGAMPSPSYEQEAVQLQPGDILVAYTDGVTEAFSADGEEFGEDRLTEVVAASVELAPEDLAEAIVRAARDWSRDTPQHDDITLVVARVK
jgi:sigma-B regulation protein RsbU (phosphoserine phosphatase)